MTLLHEAHKYKTRSESYEKKTACRCAGALPNSKHLYAAGDVTSGFEGATHQSGDCLTMVLYYGKVAGEQAAANE